MIPNHAQFLDAIRGRQMIRIVYYSSPDGGTVDRECAPLDYGPELGANDTLNRYWIWDYANTTGANPLGLVPAQIVHVHVLGTNFEPEKLGFDRPWFVLRDWGVHPELADPPEKAAAPASAGDPAKPA